MIAKHCPLMVINESYIPKKLTNIYRCNRISISIKWYLTYNLVTHAMKTNITIKKIDFLTDK